MNTMHDFYNHTNLTHVTPRAHFLALHARLRTCTAFVLRDPKPLRFHHVIKNKKSPHYLYPYPVWYPQSMFFEANKYGKSGNSFLYGPTSKSFLWYLLVGSAIVANL